MNKKLLATTISAALSMAAASAQALDIKVGGEVNTRWWLTSETSVDGFRMEYSPTSSGGTTGKDYRHSVIEMDDVELKFNAKETLANGWVATGHVELEFNKGETSGTKGALKEVEEASVTLNMGPVYVQAGILQDKVNDIIGKVDTYSLNELSDDQKPYSDETTSIRVGLSGLKDTTADVRLIQSVGYTTCVGGSGSACTGGTSLTSEDTAYRFQFAQKFPIAEVRAVYLSGEGKSINDGVNYKKEQTTSMLAAQFNLGQFKPFVTLVQYEIKQTGLVNKKEENEGVIVGLDWEATDKTTVSAAYNTRSYKDKTVTYADEPELKALGIAVGYNLKPAYVSLGYTKSSNNRGSQVSGGTDKDYEADGFYAKASFIF